VLFAPSAILSRHAFAGTGCIARERLTALGYSPVFEVLPGIGVLVSDFHGRKQSDYVRRRCCCHRSRDPSKDAFHVEHA